MLGGISSDISQAQIPRSQQVTNLLIEFGRMDLLLHFRQRWRYRHMNTCYWVRQGRDIRARSDYILGIDRCRFKMVGIRGVRNYPSENLVLQACTLQGVKFPDKVMTYITLLALIVDIIRI